MKIGDKVLFDDEVYTVIKCGPRDELTPLPGVALLGDAVVIEKDGKKMLVYDSDVEEIK